MCFTAGGDSIITSSSEAGRSNLKFLGGGQSSSKIKKQKSTMYPKVWILGFDKVWWE